MISACVLMDKSLSSRQRAMEAIHRSGEGGPGCGGDSLTLGLSELGAEDLMIPEMASKW